MPRTLLLDAPRQVAIYSGLSEVQANLGQTHNQRAALTLAAICRVWVNHPDGLPFPSQQTLAEMTGRSVRTIRRHLAALEAAGLLRVFRNRPKRDAAGRWTRRTNRYLLLTYVARAQNRRNRRSRLGDIPVPSPSDTGAVSALPGWFVPPEEGVPPIGRLRVAELRAALAAR